MPSLEIVPGATPGSRPSPGVPRLLFAVLLLATLSAAAITWDEAEQLEALGHRARTSALAGDFASAAELGIEMRALVDALFPDGGWQRQDWIDRIEVYDRSEGFDEAGREEAARALQLFDDWQKSYTSGDFIAAERFIVDCLDIHRRRYGERSKSATTTLHLLANTIQKQGRFAEAEILQRHVSDLQYENWGDQHPATLATVVNLADLLKSQGQPREARDLILRALPASIALLGQTQNITVALRINLIGAYLDLDDLDGAAGVLADLNVHRPELPWLDLYHYDAIAEHAVKAKHPDALERLEFAYLKSAGENGEAALHPDTLHRRLEWARAQAAANHPDTRQLLEALVALFDGNLGAEHLDTIEARRILGIWLHRHGDTAAALTTLRAAEAGHEQARLRVQSDGLSRAHFDARRSPSATLAACAASAAMPLPAWTALEASFGRGLLDSWDRRWARPLTREEKRQQLELTVELQNSDERVTAARRAGAARADLEELERARERLITRLLEFERMLATRYDFEGAEQVSIAEVPDRMPVGTLLIAWHHHEELGENWAFLLRRGAPPQCVRLPAVNRASILAMRTLVSTRPQGESTPTASRPGEKERGPGIVRRTSGWSPIERARFTALQTELRAALWQPVLELLAEAEGAPPIEEVIVLPSPELSGLPIGLLIDEMTVRYTPSTTFHERLRSQPRRQGTGALLAIADAGGDLRSGTLPYSRREVEALEHLFPAAEPATTEEFASPVPATLVLSGSDASEERLLALGHDSGLERFGFLHLATHAVIDEARPLRSALILRSGGAFDPVAPIVAGKAVVDGRITAEQIRRTWQLDAELVVLSACRSGMGEELGGEGFLGFSQALLSAGARTLLLSLWRVDDRATALLMGRFYFELFAGGHAKGVALRRAQEWLRSVPAVWASDLDRVSLEEVVRREAPKNAAATAPFAHPYYWAAFILVGAE